MLADELPKSPSLQPIKPYLERAKEVEETEPLLSYYANLYSLRLGIQERDTSDESANKFMSCLLSKCERLRPQFATEVDSHRQQLEGFVRRYFRSVEEELASGQIDENASERYFAARCLLDVCTFFGDLPQDLDAARQKCLLYTEGNLMGSKE